MIRATRNTIQQKFVLQAVRELGNHPTAEQVYVCVLDKHPGISKATVYNNLRTLSEIGEIAKIEVPSQSTRYDHMLHNHYHMRCRVCGRLFDSVVAYDDKLLDTFRQTRDFVIEDYSLILNGLCPECINKQTKGEKQ